MKSKFNYYQIGSRLKSFIQGPLGGGGGARWYSTGSIVCIVPAFRYIHTVMGWRLSLGLVGRRPALGEADSDEPKGAGKKSGWIY